MDQAAQQLRSVASGIAITLIDWDCLQVVDGGELVLRGLQIDQVRDTADVSSQYVGAVWPLPDRVANVLLAMSASVRPMPEANARDAST